MNRAVFAPISGSAFFRFTQAMIVATFVAGCATQAPEPPPPAPTPPTVSVQSEAERWSVRTAQIAELTSWTVRGKVAYRLPDDTGSASMLWTESPEQSRVRLSGPLGIGTTEIVSEGALLRVRRDGIDRLYPADAAPWLPSGEPLPVPVGALGFWLRGLPAADLTVDHAVKSGGKLATLSQAGWQVNYEKYAESRGVQLPSKLVLVAPDGAATIRILLREWTFE